MTCVDSYIYNDVFNFDCCDDNYQLEVVVLNWNLMSTTSNLLSSAFNSVAGRHTYIHIYTHIYTYIHIYTHRYFGSWYILVHITAMVGLSRMYARHFSCFESHDSLRLLLSSGSDYDTQHLLQFSSSFGTWR